MKKYLSENILKRIQTWRNEQIINSWINFFKVNYVKYSDSGMRAVMKAKNVPNNIINKVIRQIKL